MNREERVLERHLRYWRERGLIGVELEASLRAASAELRRGRPGSVLTRALGTLGGLLLLAGLILIVAENWAAIPAGTKLLGWAAIHTGLLAGAAGFESRGRPALGEALALVASGWMLAGIGLVSQIYQLSSRPANGVWLWLALLLPGAWLLRQRAVAVSIFVALVSALTLEVAADDSPVHAVRADAPWLWLGLPLLAAAACRGLPRRIEALPGWCGRWVFLASQVFLLVFGAAQELDRSDIGGAWLVAAPGLALALAFPGLLLPAPWGANGARLVVLASLLPWTLMGARYDAGGALDQLAVGAAWIVQLGVALLVIRAGARAGALEWVNAGYVALLAGVVTRYFDFFGNYLEGGAALALTGLLLLVVLYGLETARRRTLRKGAA